jgi:hypothetical protein
MEEVRPGEFTGTLVVHGRHEAVVSITYDTSRFSITNKGSRNLLQEGNEIHRRYNKWVQQLERAIREEIGELSAPR